MVIRVLNDRSIVKDADPYGTQNENQVTTLNFVIPEEYASFNKKIVFITPNGVYWDLITNDTYIIKNNVTKYRNVSAYVWLVDVENQVDFRTKIFYIDFNQNTNPDNFIPGSEEISGYDTMIAELNELIQEVEDLGALHYEIVEELPTEDIDPTAVYLILREESEPNNIYDEWMYIENAWEKIGSTDVDLQPLQKEIDEINEMLFTHTTAESVNQEVSLNGNSNLEMNVTELDGRIEQVTTEGNQLLDVANMTANANTSFTFENDILTISCTTGSYNQARKDVTDIIKNNGGKTIHLDNKSFAKTNADAQSLAQLVITKTDTTKQYAVLYSYGSGGASQGYAIPSDTSNISNVIIGIVANNTGNAITNTLTIVEPLLYFDNHNTYEPYTNGASPNPDYKQDIHVVTGTQDVVVSGKNVFETTLINEDTNIQLNNCTASVTNNELTLVSTGGDMYFGNIQTVGNSYNKTRGIKIYRKGNSKISFKLSNTSLNKNYITAYNKNNICISYSSTLSYEGTYTFPDNCEYVTFRIGKGSTTEGDTFTTTIMVAYGDTIPDYEPYITPITKQVHLGTKEMYEGSKIIREGNDWYFYDEYYKVIMDGTETIGVQSSGTANWFYNIPFSSNPKIPQGSGQTTAYIEIKSNYYKINSVGTGNTGLGIAIYSTAIRIREATEDTASNYKSRLATLYANGNPVYIVYKLATPTKTEITDETLLADLNAIQKLQQLNGKTIVSIEGNLGADFKLVYENDSISDLNTRVASLESGKIDKTAIVSSVSSSSTNNQVPGAKLFYDTIGDINSLLDALNGTSV